MPVSLHYQTIGDGPPVVLLHGLFGSGDNWGRIARALSADYTVITPDLRNHGRSPRHAEHHYAAMAEDVLALCEQLALPAIHLLGHSMGGKVAMQFACAYPQRLHSLTVADMAMRHYADVHTPLINAMLAIDLSLTQTRSAVDQALAPHIPDAMVRQFLLTNLHKQNDQLQWRIPLHTLKNNYHYVQAALKPETTVALPTLFIYGEHSDYLTPQDQQDLAASFSQAEFQSLPAGHWLHAEQPEAFTQAVLQFLQQQ